MDSRPEKKTDQDKYLDLQLKMSEKTRGSDLATALILIVVIFGFAIWGLLLPDKEKSEQENRFLQQVPQASSQYSGTLIQRIKDNKLFDRVLSGDYMEDMTDYLADQFPMRDMFVGIKAFSEIALGKTENNDVVLASDGWLVDREDYASVDNVLTNTAAINLFNAYAKENGIPLTFAVAGKTEDVMLERLPAFYPVSRREELWSTLKAGAVDLDYVDLRSMVFENKDESAQLYYRTDHHWTTLGAYEAYAALGEQMGYIPYPLSHFTVETVSDSFYGTIWSSSGMKWVEPDTMEYFRYPGDMEYTTEIVDAGVTYSGFYDRAFVEQKDKYSSFLSGNNSVVKVRAPEGTEDREKLLILKDSFAHSAVPFLALHYDIDMLDLRYYNKSTVASYVSDNGIDRVLVLCGIESLTDAPTFAVVAAGV